MNKFRPVIELLILAAAYFVGLAFVIGLFVGFNQALGVAQWQMLSRYTLEGCETLLFLAAVVWLTVLCRRCYRRLLDAHGVLPKAETVGRKRKAAIMAAGLVLMLAINPLYEVFSGWLGQHATTDSLQNQQMLTQLFAQLPLLMSVYIVLAAPLLEELLFRGLFFHSFGSPKTRAKRLALLPVSAFAFACLHALPVSMEFAPYFAMGLVLGGVYLCSRDLRCSIAVHVANNLIALLMLYTGA